MRPVTLSVIPAVLLVCAVAHAEPWDKPGWDLTFHDEFDGTEVDAAKWKKRYKWGEAQINSELQAYVDDAFEVSSGRLRIVGKKASGTYAAKTFDYRSGVLASYHEQTYGWFEARCRMPKGQGLWPAFWLYHTTSVSGIDEIDVHEFLGHQPTTVYSTLHRSPDKHHGKEFVGPDFTADYHVFAVDWTKDHVNFYVDGALVHEHLGDSPPVPMYLIVNLAIGGSWPGAPDSTTLFPAYYDVDYVRAYTRSATAPDAGVVDAVAPSDASTDGGAAADDGAAADSAIDSSEASRSDPVDAGSFAGAADPADLEGGCGCTAAGARPPSPWLVVLGVPVLAARLLRRVRPRSRRDRPQ